MLQPLSAPTTRLVFATKDDAQKVLDALTQAAARFGVATVGDFKDLSGVPSTYMDHKQGWTSVVGANIKQVEDGFVIDFPPTEEI